jgi:hypothetical protein
MGRLTLCGTPAADSTSEGPIPDCWRMIGVLMDPVAMITSRRAKAVYGVSDSSRNSIPVARGVESLESRIRPTLAPARTRVSLIEGRSQQPDGEI